MLTIHSSPLSQQPLHQLWLLCFSPSIQYSVCRVSAAVTQAVTFSALHKSACYPRCCHFMNIQCALVFISWAGNGECVVRATMWQCVCYFLLLYKIAYSTTAPSCAGFLEPRRSRLGLLKSTLNAENFICSLSWSICSEFGTICSWNVSCSPKSPKNSIKTPIMAFKVIQGHCSGWQSKARVWLPISV